MESILRGLAVYLFLLIVFRISGKRTLSQTTSFDLVLLLIISETTQQAMVNGDHSMTNAALLILTLIAADIVLSVLKQWSPAFDAWIDGTPMIILANGIPNQDRLDRERIDENDIMEAARHQVGLESMSQIKYAVLERGGKISIVPRKKEVDGPL